MTYANALTRVVAGAALALAIAPPTWAAPIFAPASTLTVSTCTQDGSNVPQGSASADVVNDGKGVVLSGNATSTGASAHCIKLEWGGALDGNIEAFNSIPVAFDYSVDFSAVTATYLYSFLQVSFFHEPYFVGDFNQRGYAYIDSRNGNGQFTSQPNISLEWPGPSDGSTRRFRSYSAELTVHALGDTDSVETLSVNVPIATSIDLGVLRRTDVPEPSHGALLALGFAATLRLRRITAAHG